MTSDPTSTECSDARTTGRGDKSSQQTADFGFEKVPAHEKAARVHNVFDSVAGKYDLMNDLMSLGIHRQWKDALVSWLQPQPGMQIVDVAGGTGDVARRIVAAGTSPEQVSPDVYVCDINEAMIGEGSAKYSVHDASEAIKFICGDAQSLPFPAQSLDAYTIAFGIRNVTSIDAALAEAFRVLKPGGRFLCLEFSHVEEPALQRLYDWYSFSVLPRLGKAIAGDGDAYRYLVESIRVFPTAEAFAQSISAAGFENVKHRRYGNGVTALHSGWRL